MALPVAGAALLRGYQVWPIIRVLWLSFTDYQFLTNDPANWVGFANYKEALGDPLMWQSLGRAALFTIMFLPGTIILPLLLAILIDRVKQPRLATFYRVVLLIPAVIPSTLIFVLWKWMYNYQVGPINHFLVSTTGLFTLHNAPQWLGGTPLTLPSIAIMEVWWGLGYHTIFFLAGLAAISKELPEAARIDGANEWQVFWHVDAAAARADHDDPRRAALRHRHGGDRRIPDLRRIQPRLADLHLDDLHVRSGVQDRPLAAGIRRGDRHDRRGRDDDRHDLPDPHLPSEGLTGWRSKPTHDGAVPPEASVATDEDPGWLRENRAAIVRHAVIIFFMVIILAPLAWVLMMSIKSLPDSMRGDFWPRKFDFSHYSFVFERIHTLPINLFNSIYVTSATVLITTVCAVLAGYALVHLKTKGAGVVVVVILLVSLYFPVRVVSIISIYETQHWLGLINNTSGLILPYVTLQLAISILIMRSMFQLVPHELIEAARIDGAGPLADAAHHRRADGAQRSRGHLHRQFRHRLGRVSVLPDADRRRGEAHHARRPCRRPGRAGAMGLAEPRGRLRDRRHAGHHRLHLRPEALLQGIGGRRREGMRCRRQARAGRARRFPPGPQALELRAGGEDIGIGVALPTICMPTGRPLSARPAGTVAAG